MEIRELLPKDWDKIELYMKAGANHVRIAESFGITPEFLKSAAKKRYGADYSKVCAQFRTTGELLIEATQFQMALSGNVKMLIWLGQVRLGQREPDLLSSVPPAQESIDRDHLIMGQHHVIETLKNALRELGHDPEAINADKPKTE